MNPKFTKVGIIEDQLIDSIYPAGTIYQKLGHRDGAFFSDSKMRTSFHPRLQECLDGISVQERYFKLLITSHFLTNQNASFINLERSYGVFSIFKQ